METERIALSPRDRDRLKILHEVKESTQVEAAERLKVTDRQVRRLLLAVRERGDGAVVYRLRGRPSNRKLAASFEQKILARIRQRYADFRPTLAAEHLAREGLQVSRETLRKWMVRAGIWRTRRPRIKTAHVWRERRACFGELVMQDSSPFCGLPGSRAMRDHCCFRNAVRKTDAQLCANCRCRRGDHQKTRETPSHQRVV